MFKHHLPILSSRYPLTQKPLSVLRAPVLECRNHLAFLLSFLWSSFARCELWKQNQTVKATAWKEIGANSYLLPASLHLCVHTNKHSIGPWRTNWQLGPMGVTSEIIIFPKLWTWAHPWAQINNSCFIIKKFEKILKTQENSIQVTIKSLLPTRGSSENHSLATVPYRGGQASDALAEKAGKLRSGTESSPRSGN